jgi:hypothetical protein
VNKTRFDSGKGERPPLGQTQTPFSKYCVLFSMENEQVREAENLHPLTKLRMSGFIPPFLHMPSARIKEKYSFLNTTTIYRLHSTRFCNLKHRVTKNKHRSWGTLKKNIIKRQNSDVTIKQHTKTENLDLTIKHNKTQDSDIMIKQHNP